MQRPPTARPMRNKRPIPKSLQELRPKADKKSKEAVREKEKALREVREQIGQLAILAAEQILEKEVAAEGQEEIIDRVLEKAGTSQWQN